MKNYTTGKGKPLAPEKVRARDIGSPGQKVDPSVRIAPLTGEPPGAVPMDVTLQKSAAWRPGKHNG